MPGKRTAAERAGIDPLDLKYLKNKLPKKTSEEEFLALLNRAGIYNWKQINLIILLRAYITLVLTLFSLYGASAFGVSDPRFMILLVGSILVYLIPRQLLRRIGDKRVNDARANLPLLSNQIVIAASSGLDLGVALEQIVATSLDRDRSNTLTIALNNVFTFMHSGLSLAEALNAEGERTGIPDIQRFFTSLAFVARNGGELSMQLTAIANDAEMARFSEIEYRISRLPVIQTGPLFCVFAGFFAVISAGLFAVVSENLISLK